jgi:hypothetical protein
MAVAGQARKLLALCARMLTFRVNQRLFGRFLSPPEASLP